MHEIGIVSEALRQVFQIAAKSNSRVEKVVLTVGRLSGAEPDSLRFAFEALTPGSAAESAALDIISVDPEAACAKCGSLVKGDRWSVLRCSQCGAICTDLIHGRELELTRIVLSK